ncbi:unnamed protein product [Clavelina lepadiformis]|uniref:Uncharacterized protein n=1 Tax=Clavelina lepadiformis TaxID=159417 RepID=A0ABP0G0E2_CLALP
MMAGNLATILIVQALMIYSASSFQLRFAQTCKDRRRTVACPLGQDIFVRDASYASDIYHNCPSTLLDTPTAKCSSESAYLRAKRRCHGKNSCILQSGTELVFDPCYGDVSSIKMAYYCLPSTLPETSKCHGVGNLHYKTFDGQRYDFMGVCTYVLVKAEGDFYQMPFTIEVENEHRGGNKEVAWLKKAIVRIACLEIELIKGPMVKINGEVVNLPFVSEQLGVKINRAGMFIVLSTDDGLVVNYDGNAHIDVRLHKRYAGKVEGLCGNYNKNPDDDFQDKTTGKLLDNPITFANQYQTDTESECEPLDPETPTPFCAPEDRAVFEEACSVITDHRCFLLCRRTIEPDSYFENCVSDACAFQDDVEAVENAASAYAKECRENGIEVCDWREKTPRCTDENSRYSTCMSACPATCTDQDASCDLRCVEGCQCNDGYVLSDDTCVRVEECGCQYKRRYYKNGESFQPGSSCSESCKCEDGKVTCEKSRCEDGEVCKRGQDGKHDCLPESFGTCRAYGDPHYVTPDGRKYDFMGSCVYNFATTNSLVMTDPKYFSIETANEHRRGHTRVSYLSNVTITLGSGDVIFLGKDSYATVNGDETSEYESPEFKVAPSGTSMVLTTKYHLRVSFNGDGLVVKIPSTYKQKINGLCGNYNDDESDDLEKSDGTVTDDVNEFGDSHQVGDCTDETPDPFFCSPGDRRKWERPQYCGGIKKLEGRCMGLVDSTNFMENCVFDACATDGYEEDITKAIESYVTACQEKGADLCNWRQELGRPSLECPPNSHYEGCALPCPDTCDNPSASVSCSISGTVEDCVCNVGFIKKGRRCVRKVDCYGGEEDNVCMKPDATYGSYSPEKAVYSLGEKVCFRCDVGFARRGRSAMIATCAADNKLKTAQTYDDWQCRETVCTFVIYARRGAWKLIGKGNYRPCLTRCRTYRAPVGMVIRITFQQFEMEGSEGTAVLEDGDECEHDWLQIMDGEKLSKRFCGNRIPEAFVSTTNVVTVFVTTNEVHEFKGFFFRYQHINA